MQLIHTEGERETESSLGKHHRNTVANKIHSQTVKLGVGKYEKETGSLHSFKIPLPRHLLTARE